MTLRELLSGFATHMGNVVKLRGVPAGGTIGQVIRKKSASDFATEWADAPASGGTANTSVVNNNASGTINWAWSGPNNYLKLTLTGAATLANPTGLAPGKEGILLVKGNFALAFGDQFRGGTTVPLTYSGSAKLFRFVADDDGKVYLEYVNEVNPYNDPHWPSTGFQLGTSGVNNATNNTFVDSGPNNLTITKTGPMSQGRFSPFGNGIGGSYGGGRLSVTGDRRATGNFTLSGWVYRTDAVNRCHLIFFGDETAGRLCLLLNAAGQLCTNTFGAGEAIIGATGVSVKTWTHVAFVRSGTTLTGYINGAAIGSIQVSGTIGNANGAFLFSASTVTASPGFLSSNFHYSNSARFTAAYSVPTTPDTGDANTILLVKGENAAVFDATNKNVIETVGLAKVSTAQARFTEAVVNTTGGGLIVSDSADLNFGNSDFTVELAVYQTSATGFQAVFQKRSDSNASTGILLAASGGSLNLYVSSTGSSWDVANAFACGSLTLNTWHHLTVCRSGSVWRIFRDGVQTGTFNSAATINTNTHPFCFGSDAAAATAFQGYHYGIRTNKGVARYTAAFTPPSAPFLIG